MNRSIARLLAPLGAAGLMAIAAFGTASAQEQGTYVVTVDPQVINHLDTASFLWRCPNNDPIQLRPDDQPNVYNLSSDNVIMSPWLNYDQSLQLSFTNWNLQGDQTYSFKVYCIGQAPAQPDPVPAAPVPTPQPQQQPEPQAQPKIEVGLSLADFQTAYDNLIQTLPPAPRRPHW